ncbi:MAG: CusA/CzcA family heavy metal efflux RND transporter [Pseudoxanthomonas sp.]|nr:CusA/CzcA family heavy metal efflux RND transporter [Pseudoxanthomonas sp.]
MIAALIRWSVANRVVVLMAALLLAAWGVWSTLRTPLDALPDLSDTQVILRTEWPGQPPQVVEDQLTYPLATGLLSVPGVRTVRGFSFFGDSFVYVLFDDSTDLYWARSRVLENLSQVRGRLPAGVNPSLGPDATGLGWIYQYALVDRSGRHDIGQLRALQDWFLRYELSSVPDVAEVATVGGAVRAWQVLPEPEALAARGITLARLAEAIMSANGSGGGSVIEQGEAELMVRSEGYLRSREDFERIPVAVDARGVPVTLGEVARIQRGPTFRRGLAELDGDGEVVGGIVVLRTGKDALAAIDAVKARLDALRPSLPQGVEIVPVYDRSELIREAVDNLRTKLLQEFMLVALVCALFLWHLRSALVAVVSLPLGVLAAFIVMYHQGITANLMSLGGIAIAIGAMVDAAVVMVENAHKHLERWREAKGEPGPAERWRILTDAAVEVGPALFVSLLVITLSFLPVFALQAQEGRLFAPLAYTKTYAMAAAAGLAVTLVPVLTGYLVRGRIRREHDNPLNRCMVAGYRPLLETVLRHPHLTLTGAALAVLVTLWPASRLGSEFLPPLEEGSLLYMPTSLPGLSAGKAAELLQQTDRMIRSVPEVAHVFGKAGRAETATDPAPLEMFETTVTFRPRSEWRPGMTPQKLREELDRAVQVPGLTNLWVPPIRNRVDMLSTGIKSPIGIKIGGPDTAVLQALGDRIERLAREVPGVSSAIAERVGEGRYVDLRIRPLDAARYGFTQGELQRLIAVVVGGEPIAETIEGRERYPIVLRYPRERRGTLDALARLPLVAPDGSQLALSQVADVAVSAGPSILRSDDGRLTGYVFVDVAGRALGDVVADLREHLGARLDLPPGYALGWSGQYEYLERAQQRLQLVVPVVLAVIFVLIYLVFRSGAEAATIMLSLPLSLVGGVWLVWLLGHEVSVATLVGFIALAGVAAEFGIVMQLYLRNAWHRHRDADPQAGSEALEAAIREGAVGRVRPKVMTVATILAGLFPIMVGTGAGSEVMQRIAAPMIGGMLSAPLLSMLVLPAAYLLLERRTLRRREGRAEVA